MIDRVKERAAAQLSNQKEKATDGLGSVAAMVRQGTQQLRDQRHDTIAGYVDQAADQIDKFSKQLRDKDVGELLDDAQRLARRRPAVFIGSAFALGVIGARFFKSSSEHDRRHAGRQFDYGGSVYGSADATRGNYSAGTSVGTNAAAFDDTSESGVGTQGSAFGSSVSGSASSTSTGGSSVRSAKGVASPRGRRSSTDNTERS